MKLNTYLVRWRTDTNPHYPGKVEAMDVGTARVYTSSPQSAIEYIKKNKTNIHSIIDVKIDNNSIEYCSNCKQLIDE